MIKVFVVEDHSEVRAALKRIIGKTADIVVCCEAANGEEVLSKLEDDNGCSVVLLDVSLPDLSGLEVLKRIKVRRPDLRVLMVSVHADEMYAVPALRSGASGYLTKDKAANQLAVAIRRISKGGLYFSPSIADQLGSDTKEDL